MRFMTLNPESKILLGGEQELSVREIISHIKQEDSLGGQIVHVQMEMIKILSSGA